MVLSKDTRTVLDAINAMEPDMQGRFYTLDGIFEIVRSKRIRYREDLYAVLCSAETLGLLQFADKERTCVRRLELGRSYRQINRKETLLWLRNSIIVPILVAIVTSFLTSISIPEISSHLRGLLEKFLSLIQ